MRVEVLRSRLLWVIEAFAERFALAAFFVSLVSLIPLALGANPACYFVHSAIATLSASAISLALIPRRFSPAMIPFRARVQIERGVGLFEVLVAGAVLAVVILGSTVVFSTQKQTVSKDLGTDALRDVVSIVNVDAAAIQAYDPVAHATLTGAQQKIWAVPFGGTAVTNLVTIQAQPAAGNGLSVIAKGTGLQASVVAPLPSPKATPQ